MKCEDLLKALNEYVDGQIDPAICQEFQKHLDGCNPCQVVVDNIRKTIALYNATGERQELPADFCRKLHQSLADRWKAKFPTDNAR